MEAATWNGLRVIAKRNRPQPGMGLYLEFTSQGVIISARPASEFKHPWQLACSFRPDPKIQPAGGQWVATVRPGFVNCGDVTVSEKRLVKAVLTDTDVPLIDDVAPSVVFDSFRDPAASAGLTANDDGELEQQPGEGYPDFFDSLGVTPAAKGGDINQSNDDPNRTRQIRAMDVVLITPRPSAAQEVTVLDATLDSQNVSVSTTITDAAPGGPRIRVVPQWSPPRQPTAEEILEGSAVEPTTDEVKLSTIYLVSAPGADPEAPPDNSWTPYPLYFIFWNLAHCSKAPVLVAPPDPLKLQVPLAAGVGQSLIDAMLANVNDEESETAAYLNTVTFQGMYWSPGGVGWDVATRPKRATTATPIAGLTPSAVKAATQSDTPAPPVLNPPFPYMRTKFDPFFFDLHKDPPKT